MRKLMIGVIFIMLLAGCNSELGFEDVNINTKNRDVQEFINTTQDENGTYLYHVDEKNLYIYLNGSNVEQNKEASYFSDFNVEADGDILKILFHHETTEDYNNHNLNHQLLYKVKLDKKYDQIMLFDNGEEAGFHTIFN